MRAWWVGEPGPIASMPLEWGERPDPAPGPGELLVGVHVCGVCRTDLHLAEGDLKPRQPNVIPGHEVVGTVLEVGDGCTRFRPGDRVGVAWLGKSCGTCRYCFRGDENLCISPTFTGWDQDGGYAERLTVAEDFAYAIPAVFTDEQAAPLLCSGIIGYHALQRAAVPDGGRLGIYGFGGSAHLTAQIARHQGASVYVMTRSEAARALARELGAIFVGGPYDTPPDALDSAILFAPVGDLVPPALQALDRGGTLAVAGIHLSDIPALNYQRDLFNERRLLSVTANTRKDGEQFLALAATIPLEPTTTIYPFEAADQALADLDGDRVTGSAVLDMSR
ncbi:zinc-dependent alcohol dehydrogenase family protein [Arthrobacter bambusae]|uniref:zinc-dependent alcohol dehydrogenase family protein n=1 Tax=Arthrobacter bambusae TaxID=1338426 RepID=UPI00278094D9|nr:zinc-dependent alcohol dehydrogenase family protein [Arthrobacter bambusae]MDQ0028694.1 propanol-preferring alcohol dehydrogenase [Arthrobacter bambusae]MDQ0096512.1 propanol-preferring alcohol dehydrogenase [Arthrobacter bambusae]